MHTCLKTLTVCCVFAVTQPLCSLAEEQLSGPQELEIVPASFQLIGPRSRQQLLLTGTSAANRIQDRTLDAEWSSSDETVVRIVNGVAIPVGDGAADITARIGDVTTTAHVTAREINSPQPVSFRNETLAALTKAGCNMGACHGSPSGKAGFRLSLRGYDEALDILTLRREFFGRRTNVMKPDESLLLQKPLMEVAHGGGQRLVRGEPAHSVLLHWIGEGLRTDPEDTPRLERIEVTPAGRVLHDEANRQQLAVNGFFSDGTVRDLTALTVFSSSDETVASVSPTGLVEKSQRGETAVLARYLDKMATANITFLEQVPGFAWPNPPERNFVDQLVFQKLRTLQITPSELCTEEEFVRRAYLDAIGRLPSIEETMAFLEDASPDRRDRLIDELVSSDDFASYWALKLGDVLRSNSRKLDPAGPHKFRKWLIESVRHDQPMDEFARQLLTASGNVRQNPAANYWRASRDPQDATESTAQLFLGIRIQCAKCHNHPFERWTQDNYYGIAAAFTRIGRKKMADASEFIYVTRKGEVTQPRTGQTMKVYLPLSGEVEVPDDQDRRAVFADWLTKPDNPFFARVCVNRIWSHLTGRGLVDPVDDFRDSNPPSNAELLDELARQFIANGFSRRWVVTTIMRSRTYQLSSRTNPFNENDTRYHSHAITRLLSAEPLLDAICAVTGVPEPFKGMPAGTRAVELADPPTDHYFLKVFGQPQREMACECERSSDPNLSQALQLINGPVVHGKLRQDGGRVARMIESGQSDDEIITALYLAAVCRRPDTREIETARKYIGANSDRREALEDIGWTLLNSKEFLFQH